MRQTLNQYSVFIAAGFLLLALFVAGRFVRRARKLLLAAALVVLAGAWFMLRTPTDITRPAQLEAALARDEPVVLEFFSNY